MMGLDWTKPLPLISFSEIMTTPLPPIEWLVENVIACGDRVVFYGEFGSMKSWLLLDLAIHVAAGLPWLGKFAVPEARSVLYIDEEMNQRTLRRRINRLGLGAGLRDEALPLRALSRVGITLGAGGGEKLLSALHTSGFDPDVVIVETLRRVLHGSENEAADVAAFWRNVEPILRAGKTLIVVHHMRKPRSKHDRANRERASGSTDVLAGSDTALAVQRLARDTVAIECVKSREAEEVAEFVVSLSEKDREGPAVLRFEGGRAAFQGEQTRQPYASKLALAFVEAHSDRTAKTGDVIAHLEAHGIARRTSERAVANLAKQGRLTKAEHGVWRLAKSDDGG